MATMKDVAKACGLSTMTVSYALNNKPGTVNKHTRERVIRTANQIGYRPNAIARSLRTQRTNVIALYVGHGFIDTRLPVFAELFTGLEAGCAVAKQDLLLHGNLGHESPEAVYAEIVNGKVDGVVLQAMPDDRLVELLTAARFPLITMIDRIPTLPSVVADVQVGCRLLAEHLAGKGHRKILYRTPPEPTENIRTRTAAFQEAARAYGIDMTMSVALEWSGELSDEDFVILKQRGPERCTAVVGCTDVLANTVCNACDDLGLNIPGDIAVAGYNGVVSPVKPLRNLTTIRAPWIDIGAKAIELLTAIIEGGTVPHETVFPVELIAGDTT